MRDEEMSESWRNTNLHRIWMATFLCYKVICLKFWRVENHPWNGIIDHTLIRATTRSKKKIIIHVESKKGWVRDAFNTFVVCLIDDLMKMYWFATLHKKSIGVFPLTRQLKMGIGKVKKTIHWPNNALHSLTIQTYCTAFYLI